MKRIIFCILTICICFSCEEINKLLTEKEVIEGLKEALTIGADTSTVAASAIDGFWGNKMICIALPPEAQQVKAIFDNVPPNVWFGVSFLFPDFDKDKKFNELHLAINRAAEKASKGAFTVFSSAIRQMTIADGFEILNGTDTAATHYLRTTTTEPLTTMFSPVVSDAISSVEVVTKYWEPITEVYNHLLKSNLIQGEEINPDLEQYVTGRAINGLMTLIAEQEVKIRTDPMAQVTDLLKRVFGKK